MARIAEDFGGPKVPKTPSTAVRSLDQITAERLQKEAADALAKAKAGAATLAGQLGATVDPTTGKIDKTTIDPTMAAQWYATQPKPAVTGFTSSNQFTSGGGKTVVSTYTDDVTGDVIAVYSDGTTAVISKGTKQASAALAAQQAAAAEAEAKRKAGQSAYSLLFDQFSQYGLGALVTPLQDLITQGLSAAEMTLRLRETEAYKKRFAANAQRIAKGLRALSEAEYIGLEDQYQNVMRNYGLPESYYAKGEMGVQPGFEKFLAGDVSAAELEDRIQTAQNRVLNAAPEIKTALKSFYPDITNGDILAYALDPQQALTSIKRKVGAAEIGGAALQAGLETGLARAEELQKYGVTQAQAQQGYQTIGGGLQRGTELSSIYGQSPYTQTTAEQEVFGLPSAAEASGKRKKLIGLERATFGGQTGAGGAFERERAGGY